jgi:hypothetical protein
MSYSIQATTVVPNVALPLILIVAVIGAIDAMSGATAAAGFIFASLILGDISGMRSFLAVLAFVLAWCAPSMFASMYLLALKIDLRDSFSKLSERKKEFLALLVSAALGSMLVIVSTILTDSLVINIQGKSFLRWPLTLIVAIVIFGKNFGEGALDKIRIKREIDVETIEESIFLARVMSPGVTFMLATAVFGITYVWTEKAAQSLFATLVISAPFFLNIMVFPEIAAKRFKLAQRNLLIEIVAISAITVVLYQGIQHLPMSTHEKAQAFILLGLVPVLVHSVYSSLAASS